jgi:hypothetical protein
MGWGLLDLILPGANTVYEAVTGNEGVPDMQDLAAPLADSILGKDTSQRSLYDFGQTLANPFDRPVSILRNWGSEDGGFFQSLDQFLDVPRYGANREGNSRNQGAIDYGMRSAGKYANDISGGASGQLMNIIGPAIGSYVGGPGGAAAGAAIASKWNQGSYQDAATRATIAAALSYISGGQTFDQAAMPAASAAGGGIESGYGMDGQIDSGSGLMSNPGDASSLGNYSSNYVQPDYFKVDQSLSLEPYSDYTGAGGQFQVNQGLAPEGYFPQTPYTGGQYFQVDQTLNPSSPQYNPTKWYEDALQNPKVKDLAKKLGQKGFQMLMQGMMGKPKPYPNPMQAASIPNYGQVPTTPQGQFNATPQTGMMASNVEFTKPGVMDTKPMNPLETTDYSLKKTKEEEDKKKLEETLAAQLKPAYLSDYTYWNRLA